MSETTRTDLHRSIPYAAHLTPVFAHFGVSFENEQAQSIPKANIYNLKHIHKFMGFRLEGDQVRRGPAVVEAPVALEVVPPPEVPQSPAHEDQPPVVNEAPIPQDVPQTPPFQTSSPLLPEVEIPSFTPQFQASTSTGGPSVPPELYSFLNDKFHTINSSIHQMSESFELRIQRLENSVNGQFIKQQEASHHATQRFNRLIGTLDDASLELKEHQETLEKVLQGILANSQTNLFNSQEAVSQISKTKLSFAHMVDNLEGMKNLSAHIDNDMSILKKELSLINKHGIARIDISCKGSVDTPPTGVDTMLQTIRQNDEEKCVDTGSSGVGTRSSSQKTCLSVLDSVSTQPEVVSTLVTLPREPILPVLDSVSTHSLDRLTHFGNFFTLSSTWTRGTLEFTWFGLGSCTHAPQGYFWTHWTINSLQLAIQQKRCFQNLPEIRLAARSVLLPVLALLVLPQANSHLSKHEKWSLIIEDAIRSLQGSRSSRGSQLRRLQGRSQSSSCRASVRDFKRSSFFTIQPSTGEYI
ncbi:hypothetical protein Taro_021655 [Colocasia esculenta]|uniref:Uncharacterized protein n=1 Tax=Colocasia esculenta TaxID=4460 RepID=A0A843V326_COLES|nr:hypothetical protein [Colocasia esculenta]